MKKELQLNTITLINAETIPIKLILEERKKKILWEQMAIEPNLFLLTKSIKKNQATLMSLEKRSLDR